MPLRVEPSPGPFASLAWALDEGDGPAQPSSRPSLGLNKKTTSHNTHKILMCLQNYLIFYLEVIPPLSSFIALYMIEVGEQPSRWWSRGSAYGPASARQPCLRGPFIPRPPQLCRVPASPLHLEAGGCCSPPGCVLRCPFERGFYCVSKSRGRPSEKLWSGLQALPGQGQHWQPRSLFSELRILDI